MDQSSAGRVRGLSVCGLIVALICSTVGARSDDYCIIINGLGGMPEFEENFVQWAQRLAAVFGEQPSYRVLRLDGREQRRPAILESLRTVASEISPDSRLWLFLVGHGDFNGSNYRLHIRGPDLTDEDLGIFLESLGARRTFVIAATSASGSLLPNLAAENRVVITATKNQHERQPPRFLSFFLEAANSPEVDSNKDGKVSLLEAFLFSRRQVKDWFVGQQLLQTEHALLDDRNRVRLRSGKEANEPTSGGVGMLASSAYISTPPEEAYRSLEAQQLARQKATLEDEINDLTFRKAEMSGQDYYRQLEELLVKLASLSERLDELEKPEAKKKP